MDYDFYFNNTASSLIKYNTPEYKNVPYDKSYYTLSFNTPYEVKYYCHNRLAELNDLMCPFYIYTDYDGTIYQFELVKFHSNGNRISPILLHDEKGHIYLSEILRDITKLKKTKHLNQQFYYQSQLTLDYVPLDILLTKDFLRLKSLPGSFPPFYIDNKIYLTLVREELLPLNNK